MFKKILIGLLLSAGITSSVYARDSNGVTVTDISTGLIYGMNIDHFTAYNPTSTSYIYNEAGESAATSGLVSIVTDVGPKTLHISVPTLGSVSIDFRLEGRVGTEMTTWSDLYTVNVDAATTAAVGDISIPISEYVTAYRLGVKVNTNGTDVINCTTSIITQK